VVGLRIRQHDDVDRTPLYIEVLIHADLDRVWELTQDPVLHARWDVRFSRITPVDGPNGSRIGEGGAYRFAYETRTPFHTIRGTGISMGDRTGAGGARTSALRFTTRDKLSPLGDGRGYWRYIDTGDGIRFFTGYDYKPGWGDVLDRLIVRRAVGWMTAWSFDRLRIWAETGTEPEKWPLRSAVAFWRPDRPRARSARRQPARGRAMDDAPATLDTLERP
jgi:hypothetical protein